MTAVLRTVNFRRVVAIVLGAAIGASLLLALTHQGATTPVRASALAGDQIWMLNATGIKQGVFKTEPTARKGAGTAVLAFSGGIQAPRDAATGQASGRRQHKPFSVTMQLGGSATQFFQAAATNEVLSNVTVQGFRPNSGGETAAFFAYKLTNATVSEVSEDFNGSGAATLRVAFTYQKIELDNLENHTSAIDDWNAHP